MNPGERTLLRIAVDTVAQVETARMQLQIAYPPGLAGFAFDAAVRNLVAHGLIRWDLTGSRLIPTTTGREALNGELRVDEEALHELIKKPTQVTTV